MIRIGYHISSSNILHGTFYQNYHSNAIKCPETKLSKREK